jgi:hypothetical protein
MERRILSYKLFEEKETPELTQEQIRWLNTCTSCRWEINPEYIKGLNFKYVTDMFEVLHLALEPANK